ncbi:hypothetical protein D3C75_1081950 [compost metagenome]
MVLKAFSRRPISSCLPGSINCGTPAPPVKAMAVSSRSSLLRIWIKNSSETTMKPVKSINITSVNLKLIPSKECRSLRAPGICMTIKPSPASARSPTKATILIGFGLYTMLFFMKEIASAAVHTGGIERRSFCCQICGSADSSDSRVRPSPSTQNIAARL